MRSIARLSTMQGRMSALPDDLPLAGIYLFSEDGQTLYVGRTNRLRRRLQDHARNNQNQATFAFLLAREETSKKAAYRTRGSRRDLMKDPDFRSAFDKARERIRGMDVQFVEETDPTRQALLEICAALRAEATYNDFDNH